MLYLPTIVFIRVEFYMLVILAVFFFERSPIAEQIADFRKKPFDKKYLKTVWLVVLILVSSILNKIFNGFEIMGLRDYYAAFYLFPLLIWVSKYLANAKIFKFLIIITVLESLVAVVEYITGTRTFFQDLGPSSTFTDRSLLYMSRCYGISANSSVLAVKVFIALILIDYCKFKKAMQWLLRIILFLGLFISFSRSVVLCLLLYWLLTTCITMIKAYKRRELMKTVTFQWSVLITFLAIVFYSSLSVQFQRGEHQAENPFKEKVTVGSTERIPQSTAEKHALDLKSGEVDPQLQKWGDKIMNGAQNVQSSGRKIIWLNYINFIQDNLFFGNGSDKLMYREWMPAKKRYKLVHAHNSFLQLIATNGIIIALLYFFFYLWNFSSKNYLPIIIIILYSIFNYGIFWGFSYLDAIFIIFLTTNFRKPYDYQGES